MKHLYNYYLLTIFGHQIEQLGVVAILIQFYFSTGRVSTEQGSSARLVSTPSRSGTTEPRSLAYLALKLKKSALFTDNWTYVKFIEI